MKVCILQPAYSTDYSLSDKYFEEQIALMRRCDDSMDIIVMPEACDIPCLASSPENGFKSYLKYNKRLLNEATAMARKCNAMVFVNARSDHDGRFRNTTYAINRQGEIVGEYYKQHLTPSEAFKTKLDSDYSFTHSEPTVIEMEGLRFAFLTCYDFYFYEAFANIARNDVDIVIGCSHQRSDTHLAIEIMSQFLAYNTNAYVIRSSVSMNEKSDIGGASMIVAPTGKILAQMGSRVGIATVEFDPKDKYYKPAGFGNPLSAHYKYIEQGRRPWKYRPAGSAIVRHDEIMPYPRTCAYRGFNTVAPENSLAAFGAAIAMGAEEIAFDLRFTKDGEAVAVHDGTLERVSNGVGEVREYTFDQLKKLDFGVKDKEAFAGITIVTFEEILKKFACHCVMNIHLTTEGDRKECLDKVVKLIKKYDCEKYVYFMSGQDIVLERLQREYPTICRCCGGDDGKWKIVDRAIKYECKKLQFVKGCFNQEMVDKAKANGMITNVFYSDDEKETEQFLDMGVDVILTNDFNKISQVVNKRKKYVTYL